MKKYEAMAKLDLPEKEHQWVSEQAEMLLTSFSALESIDTEGVEPLVSVLGIQNVFREDVAVKSIAREDLLANAPEQADGYFQVPRTLE
ncbi:MAG: Asp-tRNA(Asn)/Glu-tRNA(Gln) amidotransferase subunit GatC [Oscillospiraceae bacterium]|nr:Asp-tRNA(Asn)/Glu-tRNA(Gln) amidotransferase subunit GatC [Oscillospiraceae bacterium]